MGKKTYRIPLFHCALACIASLILGLGIGFSLDKLGQKSASVPNSDKIAFPSSIPSPTKKLEPDNIMTITLYFDNTDLNPNVQDCAAVFPVTRKIPRNNAPLQSIVDQLFAGPTEEEASLGYSSIFSSDTKDMLNTVNFKDGVVYMDFNRAGLLKAVEAGANSSCGGAQFNSSIEKTLLDIKGVKSVLFGNFSIDGDKPAFKNLMSN